MLEICNMKKKVLPKLTSKALTDRFATNQMTIPFNKFTLQNLQETKPKKSAVVPTEGNIKTIMDLSFTREQAIKALKMNDNNVERAGDWAFAHPGDLNPVTSDEEEDVNPAPSTSYAASRTTQDKKSALPNNCNEVPPHCKP